MWDSRSNRRTAPSLAVDRMYASMTDAVGPAWRTRPWSSQIALGHSHIASRLWLTNSTVRPLCSTSLILPRQRRWNSASPTASTSSTRRMSASRWAAIAKPEPEVHPRRVALHRGVHEPLEPGELDDVVEPAGDLAAAHAEDRPVQVGVLEAGQLAVEPGADLEQRSDPAARPAPSLGRRGDVADDLEQRALACPVGADDAERLPASTGKRDVAQRPQLVHLRAWRRPRIRRAEPTIRSRRSPPSPWCSPSR